jgi:hypothetical protein
MSDLKLPWTWDSDNGYIKNNSNTIVGHAGAYEANFIIDCVNAMAGIEDPGQFVFLAIKDNESIIAWEKLMKELLGEDGLGSVRDAINKLKSNKPTITITEDDRDCLVDMLWWLKGYKKGSNDNFNECPFHQDHLNALDKVVREMREILNKKS